VWTNCSDDDHDQRSDDGGCGLRARAAYVLAHGSWGVSYNTQLLADAFTLASEYASFTTGEAPGTGVPAGATVPVNQINTVADIMASCVDSPGGTGDGSPCGNLFSLTTPTDGSAPADTISAMLNLAENPKLNTAGLVALATASGPYQPIDAQTPSDLGVRLLYPNALTASPRFPRGAAVLRISAGVHVASSCL
jgi:hypothetical protein